MGFDVNVEFKRSMLAVVIAVCATVALCFKAIEPPLWASIVGGIYASYFTTRTVEEVQKRKNGNGYDAKILAGQKPGTV